MNLAASLWPSAVLAAIVGALWLLRYTVRAGWVRVPGAVAPGRRALAVVEVLALDGRRRVQLVRCADRHALILTGGPQDVMLGWLPENAPCPR